MRMPPPLAYRAFEGLAIHALPTETQWRGGNDFVMYVLGKLRQRGNPAQRHLLFCLLEQPSCVYSFSHLCRALGLNGANDKRKKLTLGEHVRRARQVLQDCKLPLHIALVPGVGYALCRKARGAAK